MFNNKCILVTGGTGFFGSNFVKCIFKKYKPKKVIVFSRDESKQFDMQNELCGKKYKGLKFFIGDVRDKERLLMAFDGVERPGCADFDGQTWYARARNSRPGETGRRKDLSRKCQHRTTHSTALFGHVRCRL